MPLQDISQVAITLDSGGISRAGFGVPLFLTKHNYHTDRVRSYSNINDIAADMGTDSNGYAAGLSIFGNNPSVSTFKIGRLMAATILEPVLNVGKDISFTITDDLGTSYTYTATIGGGDTKSSIVDDIVADFALNSGGTKVTIGESTSEQIVISRLASTDDFAITDVENGTITAGDFEGEDSDVVDALTNIQLVDNDWYALAWEGRDVGGDGVVAALSGNGIGVINLANTIEAQQKLYFVGSSASASITDTYISGSDPVSNTDVLAWLAELNYFRSIGWWHQDADVTFNELEFAGYNLPFDAGSVSWGNIKVAVPNAKNASGNALTSTEEQRLSDRSANWASITGGIVYTREGKVAGGEWIDIIRGRDSLQADLTADIFDLLTSQQGTKIPYTDAGIAVIKGIIDDRLADYRNNRNFLTDPMDVVVPEAANVSTDDKNNRILNDVTFTAKLAGAIHIVVITGRLEV